MNRPFRPVGPNDLSAAPITITTAHGVRLHGIQTGVLAIKQAHAHLQGIEALRLPAIVLDRNWTALLPMIAWVIEHPEGLIVVDTGEIAAANDIDSYMACDPNNRWFYKRNLPLFISPREELGAQMQVLGLDPAAVRTVILTHLHGDHTGGLGFFPNAEFLVARREYEGHLRQPYGAVRCLWPSFFKPTLLDYTGPALDAFSASHTVTKAGDLVVVPTPGHSYGHQSVLLRDGAHTYMLAGDLAFREQQLLESGLQGIAYNTSEARQTLQQVQRYIAQHPTIFLPSHDPVTLTRLAHKAVTRL
ncbi:MAG: N-acyl homoserine lactonase QqlR [Roseiflexaceae bacterium]